MLLLVRISCKQTEPKDCTSFVNPFVEKLRGVLLVLTWGCNQKRCRASEQAQPMEGITEQGASFPAPLFLNTSSFSDSGPSPGQFPAHKVAFYELLLRQLQESCLSHTQGV